MTLLVSVNILSGYQVVSDMPTSRGNWVNFGNPFTVQSLPTDPVGIFTLSLTNLALNSAIQVQAQDGTPIYNGTADTSTKILNLQAYAPGSPLNDLIIKVRKGSSAPYYQPWSTQTTAIKGSQTIFVSQIPDE